MFSGDTEKQLQLITSLKDYFILNEKLQFFPRDNKKSITFSEKNTLKQCK